MFCSFYQMQLLVLAFCTVVLARRLDQGNGLAIPAQRPMLHNRPATTVVEKVDASKEDVSKLGRKATIKLFGLSPPSMSRSFSAGCKGTQFNTLALATNVCLTGYYSPSHNILISEAPICPDGSTPKMRYYHAEGCYTKPQFESAIMPSPEDCLWGGVAPERWSMIFRCGPEPTIAPGRDRYQRADPPASTNDLRPAGVYDGIVDIRKECNDGPKFHRIGQTQRTVPVDKCITTMSNTLTIIRGATCPDGSRAKLARFENIMCNGGRISNNFGLIDILDKDIGVNTCLSSNTLGHPDEIRSIAFWCDGIPETTLTPIQGLFTKEGCGPDNKPSLRATAYQRALPDTCHPMNLLNPRRFSILIPAVCKNGSTATLALYKDQRCGGSPNQFSELGPETLNQCLSFNSMGSWAFYCEGVPTEAPLRTVPPPKARPAYKVPAQVGLYSPDACREKEEEEERHDRVYKVPTWPDTCNVFAPSRKLSIARPVLCSNGTKATLALFKHPFCGISPVAFRTVDDDMLDQCVEYKDMSSWMFWCTGEGVRVSRPKQPALIDSKPSTAVSRPMKVDYISVSPISIHLDKSEKPLYAPIPTSRHTSVPATFMPATFNAVPGPLKTVPFVPKHKEQLSVESRLKDLKFYKSVGLTAPLVPGGQLSYTACTIGQKPTFLNIPLHFCVPIIPNQPIMISQPATCPNGGPALVAFYESGMCKGKSDTLAALGGETSKQCFSYENFTSWEFWCDSTGIRQPPGFSQSSDRPITGLSIIGTYNFRVSYELYFGMVVVGVLAIWVVVFGIGVWFARALIGLLKVCFLFICENTTRLIRF
jgi:hypothetical protein